MAGIKPPKPLVVNNDIDMSLEWSEWLEAYTNYFIANKLKDESVEVRNANFYALLGRDGKKVINHLKISDEVRGNLDAVTAALTLHYAPSKNKTFERCKFHQTKQQNHEHFEDFLQNLRTQVKKCGYGSNDDEFVMDQIVVGIHSDDTREKLW